MKYHYSRKVAVHAVNASQLRSFFEKYLLSLIILNSAIEHEKELVLTFVIQLPNLGSSSTYRASLSLGTVLLDFLIYTSLIKMRQFNE